MHFSRKVITQDNGLLTPDLHEFLLPKDSKSITIGKTFSNKKLSWFACEDKLAFVHNVNNEIFVLIDLSDFFPECCLITCGEEVFLPGFNSPILILGCETNLGGLILFYHPTLRRMIRAVEVDIGVSVINVPENGYKNNPLLPEVLSAMDGVLVVGGFDGSLIFIDLHYNVLAKAIKGDVDWSNHNWGWPSKVNKLQYISRQSDTYATVKQKYEYCKKTEDSLAFLLNDNDGELMAPKHGHLSSGISCLHYSSIAAALFVGYEVGIWQMWSLSDLELLFTSKNEVGQGVGVVGMNVMEPCDDPRHYLYLWVGHSRPYRPGHRCDVPMSPSSPRPNLPPQLPPSQEPPFSLIYSLAFNNKTTVDSYGLLYSEFYKCDDIFELEMVKELDNFVSGRILSVESLHCPNPHKKYLSNRDEENEILNVWSIIWECEYEESPCRFTYVTLFDLNQWYNKMPGRPQVTGTSPVSSSVPLQDTPYLATWYIQASDPGEYTHSLWIDDQSLSAQRFFHQLDVHYYPANISFKCIKVGSLSVCSGVGKSVVEEIKDKLKLEPGACMSRPEPLMHSCLSLGFFPNFDDAPSIHSITINADVARRFLITLCVENGLPGAITGCALHWFNSACTETSFSLGYLTDILWNLFNLYKKKLDELSIGLFDFSGYELNYQDNVKIGLLKDYMKVIKSIYSALKRDYPTFDKMDIIDQRYFAIDIKSFHVELIKWFLNNNFLPECSPDLPLDSVLPYNYQLLCTHVSARRRGCPLLIDEMIKRWISGSGEEWRQGNERYLASDAYPPPSIQDMIRISLVADIDFNTKHFFLLYFLHDLLDCLCHDKYDVKAEKIISSYEAQFWLKEGQMRKILSYRDIDNKKFKDAVDKLLHKSVKNSDLETWEHRHIIFILHKYKEYSLAFRYLRAMQPPLGTTDDNKMEISLMVALGNISSAFFATKTTSSRRSILLNHFFQECIKMNEIKHVYPLPLDDYEEKSFIDFLQSSDLKRADDLILYYFINRRKYAEAFVLYEQMKRMGQCGGLDVNSKRRDQLMKSLENKFDPKVLLIQKSVYEAKNTLPPPGFFEERWKPTGSYLKFDNSNPKKPMLRSSIKELAYITVWQGQKLSKMAETNENLRSDEVENNTVPVGEKVKVTERSDLGEFKRKRTQGSDYGGVAKKPRLLELHLNKAVSQQITPTKQKLDYSLVQEMISTPKIEPKKTPHRKSPLPGPPSILRVRSGKKDEVSSCDESSSTTPRKTLKFTLPPAGSEGNLTLHEISLSQSLQRQEISDDDDSSSISFTKSKDSKYLPLADEEDQTVQETENRPDMEVDSDVEVMPGDDGEKDKNSTDGETSTGDSVASIAGSDPSLQDVDDISENNLPLEERLEKLQSHQSQAATPFVPSIISSELEGEDKDANSFISSRSSQVSLALDDSCSKDTSVVEETRVNNRQDEKWQMDSDSIKNLSEDHYDIIENNSSTSDSMDKVYTSIGAPIRKLSTIFEIECENEEPCVGGDNQGEQKDQNIVIVGTAGNYQESDLGDEKIEYNIQFGHEERYHKDFDTESENNNEDEVKEKEESGTHKTTDDRSDSDVVCLDSDSDNETSKPTQFSKDNKTEPYPSHYEDESSCKSSITRSDGYSDEDGYEEEEYEETEEEEEELYDLESGRGDDIHEEDFGGVNEESDVEIDDEVGNTEEIEHEEEVEHEEDVEEGGGLQLCISSDETESNPQPSSTREDAPPPSQSNTQSHVMLMESSPGKSPSSVTPVDPLLLEKIVSFSKTVSEEQLKGLVDVVKTNIDVNKANTKYSQSENLDCDAKVSEIVASETELSENPSKFDHDKEDKNNSVEMSNSDNEPASTCQSSEEVMLLSDDSHSETSSTETKNSMVSDLSKIQNVDCVEDTLEIGNKFESSIQENEKSILEAVHLQPIPKEVSSSMVGKELGVSKETSDLSQSIASDSVALRLEEIKSDETESSEITSMGIKSDKTESIVLNPDKNVSVVRKSNKIIVDGTESGETKTIGLQETILATKEPVEIISDSSLEGESEAQVVKVESRDIDVSKTFEAHNVVQNASCKEESVVIDKSLLQKGNDIITYSPEKQQGEVNTADASDVISTNTNMTLDQPTVNQTGILTSPKSSSILSTEIDIAQKSNLLIPNISVDTELQSIPPLSEEVSSTSCVEEIITVSCADQNQETYTKSDNNEIDSSSVVLPSELKNNMPAKPMEVSFETNKSDEIKPDPTLLSSSKDLVNVDSSNEHMVTIVAGNKTFTKLDVSKPLKTPSLPVVEETSEIKEVTEEVVENMEVASVPGSNSQEDAVSSFNTAICEQESISIKPEDSFVCDEPSTEDLNTAVILDDSFASAVSTPGKKMNITEEKAYKKDSTSSISADIIVMDEVKGRSRNIDVFVKFGKDQSFAPQLTVEENAPQQEEELGTMEVGREVKKRSKRRKHVEMVDKSTMTDKRRHSKKPESIDKNPQENITSEIDIKTGAVSKKSNLVDRSMITDKRGIDHTIVESELKTDASRRPRRRSTSLQPDEKRVDNEMSKTFSSSVDSLHTHHHTEASKPPRVIRKAVRRSIKKSIHEEEDIPQSEEVSVAVPDVIVNDGVEDEVDEMKGRKIRKVKRRISAVSSSLESIPESLLDSGKLPRNSRASSEPGGRLENEQSRFSTNEDHGSEATGGLTPRRSKRLSRHSEDSPSSLLDAPESFIKPGRKLDFIEEPELNTNLISLRKASRRSKLSRLSNLEDIVEVPESDVDSSHSRDKYLDSNAHNLRSRHSLAIKPDMVHLAVLKTKSNSRRRTHSTGSEPADCNPSDGGRSPPGHWLRSSHKEEYSETSKPHSPRDNDNSVIPDKNDHQSSSPLTQSTPSPKKERHVHKKTNRKSIATSVKGEEMSSKNSKSIKSRRRTVSSSSEPPPSIQHSPEKDRKTRASSVKPAKGLTGVAVLSYGRKSRSLHEGSEVAPYKPSSLASNNVNSPSTSSHTNSPQLTVYLEEYSENRRLTRHQKSLIERSFENSPRTPELPTTPKRRRRSSLLAGSDDEALTPVRSSKRLQDKSQK